MCFSASASFGAGVILSTIGVVSIRQAKTSSQVPFAAIPLIFAVQQVTEGFLWLSLREPVNSSVQISSTYIFLFFAQVVWPFWVPFSMYKIENDARRKKALKILLFLGTLVSAYLAYCLMKYDVQGTITGNHISYRQDYPEALSIYGGILYMISTIAPIFLSSAKRMNYLAFSILISYLVTIIFYEGYIVSVWCFFAAIISIIVFFIVRGMRKKYCHNQ